MKIWVDADACPVKNEIERIAGKRGVDVVHVCALIMLGRDRPGVEVVEVPGGPDAADEWILEHCAAGDVVVTDDIPLAAEAIGRGSAVVQFRGKELDEQNIPDRVQVRNLLADLRDRGEMTGGPPPFTARHRRDFTGGFAQIVDRLLAKKPQR